MVMEMEQRNWNRNACTRIDSWIRSTIDVALKYVYKQKNWLEVVEYLRELAFLATFKDSESHIQSLKSPG